MASTAFILLILLIACPNANQQNSNVHYNNVVIITYTGNMGVLISNEKTAVWIDGLHEYYGPAYLNPPDSLLENSFSKKRPFENLKWLLFTHYHRDHFSKKLTSRFLQLGLVPGIKTMRWQGMIMLRYGSKHLTFRMYGRNGTTKCRTLPTS
jgi:hypothetical protein